MISEIKINSSFPLGQFQPDGYATPHRLDRNANGSWILLHIREGISTWLIPELIEGFFVKMKLRKKNSSFAALLVLRRSQQLST